ncbi:hypothetical protein KAR91_23285 [Candidatus Pacearchaeota archaeon]|nr:hypothetical protein [Candidatus Pacearchaeota archaeon]
MAFPTTGILDNFNRSDGRPMTGWTDDFYGGYVQGIGADGSDAYQEDVENNASAAVWDTQYNADQEVYVTVTAVSATNDPTLLYARLTNYTGLQVDGYQCRLDRDGPGGADVMQIQRIIDSVTFELDESALGVDFVNGDKFGLELIDTTATSYFKDGAAAWASVGTGDASQWDNAGHLVLMFGASGGGQKGDDFGGGNVVGGATQNLIVADGSHAHAGDAIGALTGTLQISPAGSGHAHAGESPGLSGLMQLIVAESSHAHAADKPNPVLVKILTVADALHAHAGDAVGALTGTLQVAPADSSHAHAGDAVGELTGTLQITPADSVHAHSTDALALAGTLVLVAADAIHAHKADTPTLTALLQLVVDDAAHAHGAEKVVLTTIVVQLIKKAGRALLLWIKEEEGEA